MNCSLFIFSLMVLFVRENIGSSIVCLLLFIGKNKQTAHPGTTTLLRFPLLAQPGGVDNSGNSGEGGGTRLLGVRDRRIPRHGTI